MDLSKALTAGADGTDRGVRFEDVFGRLAAIGRQGHSWSRLAWTKEDLQAREWFAVEAERLGLRVETDRSGNVWAWWGEPGHGAVVTGSHLDTVPGGGAYDGALGVVSGLLAVEELQRRGASPRRPVAVVAFADEEGSRFNTPCLGSGLLTGELEIGRLSGRVDAQGESLGQAVAEFGIDIDAMRSDPERLAGIAAFVELHIEQGRGLGHMGHPLGVCGGIWPHGRWRAAMRGEANHAGTTPLADRHDPMRVLATAIDAAAAEAASGGGVATIGRLSIFPNAANGIAAGVDAWLDARAPDDAALDDLVDGWSAAIAAAADSHGVEARVACESRSAAVVFDEALRDRMLGVLEGAGIPSVVLDTAAGHDAGVLAAHVPAGMLFVRNPTGVSHNGAEFAAVEDCLVGIQALAHVLADLART